MEQSDPQRVCTNSHLLSDYPDEFRGAERIGINFKGFVEYWDDDTIYELVYEVGHTHLSELNVHNSLGETPDEHIRKSAELFDEWRYVE